MLRHIAGAKYKGVGLASSEWHSNNVPPTGVVSWMSKQSKHKLLKTEMQCRKNVLRKCWSVALSAKWTHCTWTVDLLLYDTGFLYCLIRNTKHFAAQVSTVYTYTYIWWSHAFGHNEMVCGINVCLVRHHDACEGRVGVCICVCIFLPLSIHVCKQKNYFYMIYTQYSIDFGI